MLDGTRAEAPATDEAGSSTEISLNEAADTLLQFPENAPASTEPAESGPSQAGNKDEQAPDLTDDTIIALKDGTSLSLRELKRGFLSRKAFTAKTQALADERHRFEEFRELVEAQARTIEATREALGRAANALLPRQPDPSMIDVDPQAYKAQLADFQWKMGLLAEVEKTARMETQAADAARAAEVRDRSQRQQTALLDAMPELSKPEIFEAFWRNAIETMADYGYTPAELQAGMVDHRLFLAVRDLAKLRSIRKDAPKAAAKVKSLPVMRAGKRMDVNARKARIQGQQFEQLRKSGRMEDAVQILTARIGK